jgi:diguanylate cyclase (GGDEF)-like protein
MRHPWSSLQDALLLAMAMLVSALLALQYNLFSFTAELSDPKREISLSEAVVLTILLAFCIVAFILRRLYEERRDVARQVTAKIRMRELRWQASRDSLTNLANRRSMLKALTTATSSRGSNGRKHAFFLIDLNDFKRINDLHGHAFGDRVLQIIVRRLRKSTRPSDLLARLGGDEFALLCYDVDRDTALAIGHRFIAALEGEIRAGGYSHIIGASIGAVLIPDDGANAEEVIHHADLATYARKAKTNQTNHREIYCGHQAHKWASHV